MSWFLVNIFQKYRKCFNWPANGTVGIIFPANKFFTARWTFVRSALCTMYEILDLLTKQICSSVNFTLVAVPLTALKFLPAKQQNRNLFCPLPAPLLHHISLPISWWEAWLKGLQLFPRFEDGHCLILAFLFSFMKIRNSLPKRTLSSPMVPDWVC